MSVLVSRRAVSGHRTSFGRDLWRLARPWFWPVSLLPYYVGVVLASHRLVPAVSDWPRLALGAVVAGPLIWLSVLAVNDSYDVESDRRNPRKAGRTPLTTGTLTATDARGISAAAGVAAVAVAALLGPVYALGTVGAVALGWLYSAPPTRLKSRPGADVALNALAVGVLGPLAGWAAGHGLAGFPWALAVQGTLVGAALYIPTTLVDLDTDRRSGDRTVAVALGRVRTYRLGLVLWCAAAAWSVLLAATDSVIPRTMLPLEAGLVPALIAGYHGLLRDRCSLARIAAVSVLFLAPSVTFVLTYTGTLH